MIQTINLLSLIHISSSKQKRYAQISYDDYPDYYSYSDSTSYPKSSNDGGRLGNVLDAKPTGGISLGPTRNGMNPSYPFMNRKKSLTKSYPGPVGGQGAGLSRPGSLPGPNTAGHGASQPRPWLHKTGRSRRGPQEGK